MESVSDCLAGTFLPFQHDTSLTNTKIRGFYVYIHIVYLSVCVCVCVKCTSQKSQLGQKGGSGTLGLAVCVCVYVCVLCVCVCVCVRRLGSSLLLAGRGLSPDLPLLVVGGILILIVTLSVGFPGFLLQFVPVFPALLLAAQ